MNQDGRALEIWLSGVHSDIGGGYRKEGIGDIVLRLLIHWVEEHTQQHCYQATLLSSNTPSQHLAAPLATTAHHRTQAPR